MENLFNKKCFFMIKKQLFRGVILKKKKNKYVIRVDTQICFNNQFTDLIYLKKELIMYNSQMINNFIKNLYNEYFIFILINNQNSSNNHIDCMTYIDSITKEELNKLDYTNIVNKLIYYFPSNELLIEMKNSING